MDWIKAVIVWTLLAAVLPGCGGDGGPGGRVDDGPVVVDGGAGHVHGLGVDPADETLVIATHSGMFRAAPGQRQARRIGDRRQDTMGFTVVGPRRYLGSGHPDLRDDLPPLLGLIRSDDAGRSWKPVSLLGEVDFHVLRARGRRIYGVDAQTGALLASVDGGRRWQRRTPPGPLLDLAIDPQDPERIVAAAEDGLHVSADGGRRWRLLSPEATGLLAWGEDLVLLDADGGVHSSGDDGKVVEAGGNARRAAGGAGIRRGRRAARSDPRERRQGVERRRAHVAAADGAAVAGRVSSAPCVRSAQRPARWSQRPRRPVFACGWRHERPPGSPADRRPS